MDYGRELLPSQLAVVEGAPTKKDYPVPKYADGSESLLSPASTSADAPSSNQPLLITPSKYPHMPSSSRRFYRWRMFTHPQYWEVSTRG
jgi:hypothetical protein